MRGWWSVMWYSRDMIHYDTGKPYGPFFWYYNTEREARRIAGRLNRYPSRGASA